MNFLTDAELRLMGHDPDTCDCDLCWPPNTDPVTLAIWDAKYGQKGTP
jgi:hypothetical protein